MKTIIDGPPKKYRTRCSICRCIFDYELSDTIVRLEKAAKTIAECFSVSVECPVCGKETPHSSSEEQPTGEEEKTYCVKCAHYMPALKKMDFEFCPYCGRRLVLNRSNSHSDDRKSDGFYHIYHNNSQK